VSGAGGGEGSGSEDAFGVLMASLDTAMSVVTTVSGDERAGCLIGFQAQSSIEPARFVVWLSKANHTCRVALHAEHLAVHFLTADDTDLAELFGTLSGDDVDKFGRCAWRPGPSGVPLLDRCPNRLVLARHVVVDEGGDHVCLVGRPVAMASAGPFTPLRLAGVSHLTAGHAVAERPRPPTERAPD
jgi:flavin reductase (DIM6/NTAB) family NADH-FMN oxidoreductase RutF